MIADAVALDAWRGARAMSSSSSSSAAAAFLDLHLPLWASPPPPCLPPPPPCPPAAATQTQTQTQTQVEGFGSSSSAYHLPARLGCGAGGSHDLLGQHHSPMTMIAAPLSLVDSAAADISSDLLSPQPHGQKRGNLDSQGGAESTLGTAAKRSKLEQQVERCRDVIRRCRARGDQLPRHQKRVPGRKKQQQQAREEGREGGAEQQQEEQQQQVSAELELEYQDAAKLKYWKQALLREGGSGSGGQGQGQGCPAEVRCLLDQHLPHWRDASLKRAHEIVERCVQCLSVCVCVCVCAGGHYVCPCVCLCVCVSLST
jgi:hypothetical protein